MPDNAKRREGQELPDWFGPVAEDVLGYCRPQEGVWIDLGCGSGGVGLALARMSCSTMLLIDPQAESLIEALHKATALGLEDRVMAVVARAESMPLPDCSVDLLASRGSIFFWDDPAEGLHEVYRILRHGARAMIGGGFGTSYPEWAVREFFRRSDSKPPEGITGKARAAPKANGKKAMQGENEPRRAEWLAAKAHAAGLEELLVEPTPPGLWLLFEKKKS